MSMSFDHNIHVANDDPSAGKILTAEAERRYSILEQSRQQWTAMPGIQKDAGLQTYVCKIVQGVDHKLPAVKHVMRIQATLSQCSRFFRDLSIQSDPQINPCVEKSEKIQSLVKQGKVKNVESSEDGVSHQDETWAKQYSEVYYVYTAFKSVSTALNFPKMDSCDIALVRRLRTQSRDQLLLSMGAFNNWRPCTSEYRRAENFISAVKFESALDNKTTQVTFLSCVDLKDFDAKMLIRTIIELDTKRLLLARARLEQDSELEV